MLPDAIPPTSNEGREEGGTRESMARTSQQGSI